MPNSDHRTLVELLALYKLEPKVRDVYVEGSADRSVVQWFLQERNLSHVVVKQIDHVDVPAEVLAREGVELNNRGRVIALAHILERELGKTALVATCLADADFDHAMGKTYGCRLLLLTDYSSMEMYFFNRHAVNRLLTLVVRNFPKDADTVLQETGGSSRSCSWFDSLIMYSSGTSGLFPSKSVAA